MVICLILEFLVDIGVSFLTFILDQITFQPNLSTLTGYIAAIADVWGYLNSFVDLSVVSFMVLQIIIFDNLSFILKLFSWIWDKLPLT